MPNILIVCTANICRSPVAEGLLRSRLHEQNSNGWTVRSAGTWAIQKRGASQNSILLMSEQGIDISAHRARMITPQMLAEADLVLCMEPGHAEALRAEFPKVANKIYLLSEMVGKHYAIADPYGRDLPEYKRMVTEIENLIDQGLPRIIELANENARKRGERSA